MKQFTIQYCFTMEDHSQEIFNLDIDAKSITLKTRHSKKLPSWTSLGFHQCPNCPLSKDTHSHCPVAVNILEIIIRFDRLMSFDKMRVEVVTKERSIVQETSAQEGLSSLMGLLIATSECPLTDFFKPMARFHLPFANKEETIWRATSTYLLAGYFQNTAERNKDLKLKGLAKIYDDIELLNNAIIKRLRYASQKDSAVNALVHLDVFAKYLTPPIEDSLQHIRQIFTPFVGF